MVRWVDQWAYIPGRWIGTRAVEQDLGHWAAVCAHVEVDLLGACQNDCSAEMWHGLCHKKSRPIVGAFYLNTF